MKRNAIFFALTLISGLSFAATFPLPRPGSDIIGALQYVHPKSGQTIYDIAKEYNMGYYQLIETNPDIYRHSALPVEDAITIPSEYILPNVPMEGIVVNLPELRLYYYPKVCHCVKTFPIAIGRYEWKTPTVTTKVADKEEDPYWKVPKSIKIAAAQKGKYWPDVVPPGPENPLGKFALRLGYDSYLIHGTNEPNSIGKRASSGCMRMYPSDIEELFSEVPVGTPVRVVDEWFKLGWHDGALYLEVHEPLAETARTDDEQQQEISQAIQYVTRNKNVKVNWSTVQSALEEKNGIPIAISNQNYFGNHNDTHDLSNGLYEAKNR